MVKAMNILNLTFSAPGGITPEDALILDEVKEKDGIPIVEDFDGNTYFIKDTNTGLVYFKDDDTVKTLGAVDIVDNLTTDDSSKALIPKQVKPLKELLDSHNHDNKYYTETEVDEMMAQKTEEMIFTINTSRGALNINPFMASGLLDYNDYKDYIDNLSDAEFSIVTNDTSDTFGSMRIAGNGRDFKTDNFYPIDSSQKLQVVVDLKYSKNGISSPDEEMKSYIGYIPYDSDKNVIRNGDVARAVIDNEPVIVELTRDYAPGTDDYVYFKLVNKTAEEITDSGILNYKYVKRFSYYKPNNIGLYCYIGANGRQYDEYGYCRDRQYYSATTLDDSLGTAEFARYYEYVGDLDDGSKEYRAMHKKDDGSAGDTRLYYGRQTTFVAGDRALFSNDGGTYIYMNSDRFPIDAKYKQVKVTLNLPLYKQDKYDTTHFRNGTAFIKPMVLPQYIKYNTADGTNTRDIPLDYTINIAKFKYLQIPVE